MSSFTKIYWRSSGVPTWGLIFLIVLSVIVMVSAENIKQRDPVVDDNYATMVNASKIMREGMQVLKPLRAKLAPINPEFDPNALAWLVWKTVLLPLTMVVANPNKPLLTLTGQRSRSN